VEKVPDSTTICRFHNLLVERDLLDTLLAQVNSQLEAQGCQVEKSKGCGCDLNPVCSPPCQNLGSGGGGEAAAYMMPDKPELSKDPDATWSKKGPRATLDTRALWLRDAEDGFVGPMFT